MDTNTFKESLVNLLHTVKASKIKGSENHYTAEIILPFFQTVLGLPSWFDQTNNDGKRPDLKCFLSKKDKAANRNAVISIESKMPKEFLGMTIDEVVSDYLEDKIIPYVIESQSSIQYLILHSFDRFFVFNISDEIIIKINEFISLDRTSSAKENLVDKITASCKEFDLQITDKRELKKKVTELAAFLQSKMRKDVLSNVKECSHIKSKTIHDNKSLEDFCRDVCSELVGTEDAHGVYYYVKEKFDQELEKETSPMKISFRLFLSTRFPELEETTEIDKKDNEEERDLFATATIYNLVLKVFTLKYVEDLYQDGSTNLINSQDSFINKSIASVQTEDLSEYFENMFSIVAEKSPDALKNIFKKNDFFDWVFKFNCLNNESFKSLITVFQSIDFNRSINEYKFDNDILGAFFEYFSENFNKTTRKVLGQYYTPKEVVRFIWQEVLKVAHECGADLSNSKILDPACGSGTFVVEGLALMKEQNFNGNIIGFDTSPLATGMAEINIYSQLLKDVSPAKRKDIKPIDIYCTDSLKISESSYWQSRLFEEDDSSRKRMLDTQNQITREYKKNKQYTLVVTNPPYNGSSNRSLESFKGKFTMLDYLIDNKKNDDRIRDDYVWFFGAIDRYINDNGFVGLVTSDTYLYKRTYENLRNYLYDNYKVHSIYQLGENIFDDVKVGTAIIILSKLDDASAIQDKSNEIRYYGLSQLKQSKKDRLLDERYMVFRGEKTVEPVLLSPAKTNSFSFVPVTEVLNATPFFSSNKGEGIVSSKQPGIVPGFKEFFIDESKERLESKIEEFFKLVSLAKRLDPKLKKKVDCKNENIRSLGEELNSAKKFKDFQTRVSTFLKNPKYFDLKKNNDSEEKGELELYTSFLVASAILKDISLDLSKIKRSIQIRPESSWSINKDELQYIYFDDAFAIPRVTKNGSSISGGPITCWRKDHDKENKIIFTTPSGKGGYNKFLFCSKKLSPIVQKTVKLGQAEAHFCSLNDLLIPESFKNYFSTKMDLALYCQSIANSKWAKDNIDYVISNRLPIPNPNDKNIESINEIVQNTKIINDFVKIKNFLDFKLRPSKDEFFFTEVWKKDLSVPDFSTSVLSYLRVEDVDKQLNSYIKKNDSSVSKLFLLRHSSKTEVESAKSVKEVVNNKKIGSLELNRLGVTSFILKNFRGDQYFGRTKYQKVFFMIDLVADVDFKTKYEKQAAGPLDAGLIYNEKNGIEALGQKFEVLHVEEIPKKKIAKYSPGKNLDEYYQVGSSLLSSKIEQVNRLIRFMQNQDTESSEIIATVFAIWNDLKAKKSEVTVNILVEKFLNQWHPQKKIKFKNKILLIKRLIKQMRENEIEPPGLKVVMK